MKYLLDTHTLLWYLQGDKNLSEKAQHTIDTAECFYSTASMWEIAIKQSIGKLRYKETIPSIMSLCKDEGFCPLYAKDIHFEGIKNLPFIHRDPFDRLLVSQAIAENLVIITRDAIIPQYNVKTLW